MSSRINRRSALATLGAAGVVGTTLKLPALALQKYSGPAAPVKLGVIADLHGGLAVDAASRLDAFLQAMRTKACHALVQLGDFAFPNAEHQVYADQFNAAHAETIHVIGNHEFDFGLTRQDCYRAWGIEASYYRRDVHGLRILVLDGNERGSSKGGVGYPAYIGPEQQQWLREELEASDLPVLVLSHQPLAGTSAIDNASELQQLLSRYATKIVACLNGHSHVDAHLQISGVSYIHINSASYYWVGGKTRMVYYMDPLFATITLDPVTATLSISASSSTWRDKSPKQIGYFEKEDAPPESIVTPQIRPHHVSPSELRVMTWNIWGKLNQDPRYDWNQTSARERTIEIVRQSGADVVAMIETYGSAADIAQALGFHYHTSSDDANLCIFSRYPLSDIELLEGLNPFSFIAATVTLPRGQRVRVYDVWLTSGGRHIVDIKDQAITDEKFAEGDDVRFEHLQELLKHPVFQRDLASAESIPMVVAGDFNCVSHLDYTEATRSANLNQGRVLSIQVSEAMARQGFIDTYRDANPKLSAETLGHTWTTVGTDYVYQTGEGFVRTEDHPRPQFQNPYTRIDYVYARGNRLQVVDSSVIRHHPAHPKRQFPAFPSDHAAVLTTFRVSKDASLATN